MLRYTVHDVEPSNSAARLEHPIASLPQLHRELEQFQLIVAEQRREIDHACVDLVRHRQVSLQLLERLHAQGATITSAGEVCHCSRALADLLDSSPHQLQGKSVLEFFPRNDRHQFLTLSRECLRGHRDVTFDSQFSFANRPPMKVRLTLTEFPGWALADQAVAPELLLLVSVLKKSNSEAAPGVVQSDYDEQRTLAERHDTIPVPSSGNPTGLPQRTTATDSIGWFAGGVAHEFNNVLTAVTCNISMALMEMAQDSAAASFLVDAANAVNQASVLTRQLLEFSRRQPTTPELSRVDQLVEAARNAIEQVTGEKISIRMTHQADSGVINVDPRQFEMVLLNLVRNSRDAMLGSGTLFIETTNVVITHKYAQSRPPLSPGSYVAMRVVDHGCGMSHETLERLFEPFFTTKPRGQGIGLGLATSFVAVKHAGGGIEVNSSLGKGTTVTVYWPRILDADRAPMTVRVRVTADGGPETILLVEDEGALRTIGVRILSRLGYRVLSAANGIEALEVAARHPGRIDLLFTDIVMPGMNGRELSLRLRRVRPDLKVLYTSGYSDRVFEDDPANEGANGSLTGRPPDYLSKPYMPEALASRVKEMLRSNANQKPEELPGHPR